jgi:Tubulin-tyrosine ligase family
MPDDYEAFKSIFETTQYLWIVKPANLSRGRGIYIV